MEQFLRVGVIANTHGLKGEVKVYPTTDDIHRFKDLKKVILKTKKGDQPLTVTSARPVKNLVVVKFEGIDSIDDVISWKGCDLMVSREDAIPLAEGEYFIADLIGCKVIGDDGRDIGVLKDVLETGANDVLIVNTHEGKELLIPWIDDCLLSVDLEKEEILVHLLEGLEE